MSQRVVVSKFGMGRLVVTPSAKKALTCEDFAKSLTRHLTADWGNLDEYDWKMNDQALEFGGRILSEYITRNGTRFRVMTECDRSKTTIHLSEEY